MSVEPAPTERSRGWPAASFPWLTALVCAACVVVTALEWMHVPALVALKSEWLSMRPPDVGTREYWRSIFPSVLFHQLVATLIADVAAFAYLGALLERRVGRMRWIGLVGAAAIVTSTAELVLEGAHVGASGVVYALLGCLIGVREPRLSRWVVVALLGWLVLGYVLWILHVAELGNGVHTTGLVFGLLVGALARWMEDGAIITR